MFKKFLNKRIKAIENIDPKKFTPKNLQDFYVFLPIWFINFLCKMAVKQGVYNKNYDEKGKIYYSLNK